jgi:arachidonate 15-lipoxygenase
MGMLADNTRWLQGGRYYSKRQATLAHNDPDPATRAAILKESKERYRYDHDALSPLPLITDVPRKEKFAKTYIAGRVARNGLMLPNAAAWKADMIFDHFDSIEEYQKMYPVLPDPRSAAWWDRCDSFAEQRLSGTNPMEIQRVLHADDVPFDVPGIADKLARGKLFKTDYRKLSWIKGGKAQDGETKHLPKPTGLFEVDEGGKLMPLAIQLDCDARTLWRGKASEEHWLLAKICHQVADSNYHEMVVHLTHTHLCMAPFAIATNRQLADNHPVAALLRPHIRFLLTNNALGLEFLLNPDGIVDHLLAGSLEESLGMVTRAFESWSIKDSAYDANIVARGVDDAEALPNFAWRDDGRLLWDAIGVYVREYLELYYPHAEDLTGDAEIQAWTAELASPDFGRINDMPERLETVEELAKILHNLIFTLGPQHSAVNYSQWDYFAFVPNAPLAIYCDPHTVETHAQIMKMLPGRSYSEQQLEAANQLTCYRFDEFGRFDDDAFVDARAKAVVGRLQNKLDEIEKTIATRNDARKYPYPYLAPSKVLNSPSI